MAGVLESEKWQTQCLASHLNDCNEPPGSSERDSKALLIRVEHVTLSRKHVTQVPDVVHVTVTRTSNALQVAVLAAVHSCNTMPVFVTSAFSRICRWQKRRFQPSAVNHQSMQQHHLRKPWVCCFG